LIVSVFDARSHKQNGLDPYVYPDMIWKACEECCTIHPDSDLKEKSNISLLYHPDYQTKIDDYFKTLEAYKALTGLGNADIARMYSRFEELFSENKVLPNLKLFLNLEDVKTFFNVYFSPTYFSSSNNLKILGIGIAEEFKEEFIAAASKLVWGDSMPLLKGPVPEACKFLGYDPLTIEGGRFSSGIFKGNYLYYKEKMGLKLNEHLMFDDFESAKKAAQDTFEDRKDYDEMTPWFPFSIYEVPL
jgi:hypothetical protein